MLRKFVLGTALCIASGSLSAQGSGAKVPSPPAWWLNAPHSDSLMLVGIGVESSLEAAVATALASVANDFDGGGAVPMGAGMFTLNKMQLGPCAVETSAFRRDAQGREEFRFSQSVLCKQGVDSLLVTWQGSERGVADTARLSLDLRVAHTNWTLGAVLPRLEALGVELRRETQLTESGVTEFVLLRVPRTAARRVSQ